MKKYLILDYETRSEVDLKKVGAYEYAKHPSTQILCASWKLIEGGLIGSTEVWSPFLTAHHGAAELFNALLNGDITLVAHNAFFEQVITRFVLTKHLDHNFLKEIPSPRWICTASLAAALALPRSLEGACKALNLPVQKDMEGRRLILKYCKPRKPTKNDKSKWHNRVSDLKRLMQYCQTDVEAETLLFQTLPPLNPLERKVWELDQKINFRGFHVDRPMVQSALKMIEEETTKLNEDTVEWTSGAVDSTTQRDALLDVLNAQGCDLPDLTAKTVRDALGTMDLSFQARSLLEIRQAISKTSTAKYAAFEARSVSDSRIRDHMLYHGASTGRWTGAGVQPHNFPRGTIKDTAKAAELICDGDLEMLRLIYGNPMEVFSSCLRAVITASPGKTLFCQDYSSIEARMLLWFADDREGLDVYRRGEDPYRKMAALIFEKPIEEVTKAERDGLGKQAELGCGFGMGPDKFLATCEKYGIKDVDENLAKKAVGIYRELHDSVVSLWNTLERAAIYAVKENKRISIYKTVWFVENGFLYCKLPSKRRLAYYGPEIRYQRTPWGEVRPKLYHWGVNPLTRQWTCDGTYGGRLTENVVQAASRDVMAEAKLRIENAGFEVVLSVHDEILAEKENGSNLEFKSLVSELPAWAQGLPLKTEGWTGLRYHK